MRALAFKEKLYYRTDYPMPKPEYNEALIRVTCVGICGTDIEITKGYMEFNGIPGHEFTGIVEKCSEKRLEGKRVAGEINIGCGVCRYCLNRMGNHCPNRSVMGILKKDGAFAEYITLPAKNLHCIPDSVLDHEAVFVEPLAAAFEITRRVHIKPGDKVCVLGDGKLGLLVAQVLSLTGCYLAVIGHYKDKLSILDSRGIETFNGSIADGKKFDFVVECTGSPCGLEEAYRIVNPGGSIIMKTTSAIRESINLNCVVIDEVSIIGSRCGPFAPALRTLAMKIVDVNPIISKTFSLEDGIEAFRYASKKGILKVIIKI